MTTYLTTAEAANLLRVTPATVRRWARQGMIPTVRDGRQIMIPKCVIPGVAR